MDNFFKKSLLGLNIKHLRMSNKLTQNAFSRILGVKPTTLSNWEVGVSSPDLDILTKISKYFGVNLDDLTLIDYSSWGKNKNKQGETKNSDLRPPGPCQQCEIREKLISQQEESIKLLKEKIEDLKQQSRAATKPDDTDYRQTG